MTEPLTGIEVEVLAKQLREAISFGQAQAEKRETGHGLEDQPSANDWVLCMGGSTETLKTKMTMENHRLLMGDTSSNRWDFPLFIVSLRAEKHLPMANHLLSGGPILQAGWMIQCYFKLDTDKFAGMDNHPGPGIWFSSISVDIIFFSS